MGLFGIATLALAAVLAVALVWWWRFGRRVAWVDVPRYVGEFSAYAARGGVLDIRHEKSRRTIQFALVDEGDTLEGNRTLEFAFPDMNWSAAFFDELVSRVESQGYSCIVEDAPRKTTRVRRFLSVVYRGTKGELVEKTRGLLDIVGKFLDAVPSDVAKIRSHGGIRTAAIEELKARATR
jgi:hypothetical protein